MKALTIHQPYASLIVEGLKAFEWRGWRPPAWLVGQRLVIHAGLKKPDEGVRDLERDDCVAWECCGRQVDLVALSARLKGEFPRGVGLGTAIVGRPLTPYGALGEPYGTGGNWAWPMLSVERWPSAVPAKGAQGLWDWPE